MSLWESGFGGLGTDIDACGVLRVLVLVWRMAWDDGGRDPYWDLVGLKRRSRYIVPSDLFLTGTPLNLLSEQGVLGG